VLQCVAVCYSVLQCIAVCCSVLQQYFGSVSVVVVCRLHLGSGVLQLRVAVYCSMLQYVEVCCNTVLQ